MKVLVARVNKEKLGWNTAINNLIQEVAERCSAVTSTDEAVEELMEAIDSTLIYCDDLWAIMMAYQTPCTANWDKALTEFVDDCNSAIEWVIEESPF